jgi:pimeloyl-ACP methyl ester carboxylesterase
MATFSTHDGVELAYEDRGGNGFPLVMLHGWGQTQAMFRHQLADLALDRRVITLDLRGHGRSTKPHFGYRIARFSRDVYELLDYLGLQHTDVLGWSMGVSVWWSFIDQYGTDRIRRFIAVDQPSAVAAVPWMTADQQAESGAIFDVAALLTLGAALTGTCGIEVRNGFVRGMFSGEATDPEVLSFVMAELDTVPPYVGVPLLFDHSRPGLARRVAAHRCTHPRDRMRRQPRRPLITALHRGTDPQCQSARLPDRRRELPLPFPGESVSVQRSRGTVPRASMTTKIRCRCAPGQTRRESRSTLSRVSGTSRTSASPKLVTVTNVTALRTRTAARSASALMASGPRTVMMTRIATVSEPSRPICSRRSCTVIRVPSWSVSVQRGQVRAQDRIEASPTLAGLAVRHTPRLLVTNGPNVLSSRNLDFAERTALGPLARPRLASFLAHAGSLEWEVLLLAPSPDRSGR